MRNENGYLGSLYGGSLALLTDLYQLTMAQGYWKTGLDRHEAVFNLTFRGHPFGGGYAVACGLELAVEYLVGLRFARDDIEYLATLRTPGGEHLFEPQFLEHLAKLRFASDVDAMLEGTAAFAPEPLLRVRGPLLECQLVETALLNLVNFQTLIATKASRVALAARGAPVMEFGLRRAQGIDGGVGASRAAYAGGCAATSNVLAGKLLGIPVKGTHAHSWVLAFGDELEAFQAYADALPGDCAFLVDTYDTLEGVRHAAEVGRWLRARGRRLAGVRLDSGDLGALSVEARLLLDEAGLEDTAIIASNDLDERSIARLSAGGAPIAVWGVGTRLVTGDGQPALGGVYKLAALRAPGGAWREVAKRSDDPAKASLPGALQVRRRFERGRAAGDTIFDLLSPRGLGSGPAPAGAEDLLVPVLRAGQRVLPLQPLESIRCRTLAQLAVLPAGARRLDAPERYPVGLEPGLPLVPATAV